MNADKPQAVITRAREITAPWLTAKLHAEGHLRQGEVQTLAVGLWRRKRLSDLYLLTATYAGIGDVTLPATFMLKVSRPETLSSVAHRRRWKEYEFYTRVAPAMDDPPIPQCFAAAFDAIARRSHLLLQDLTASHVRPPTPTPPTSAQLCGDVDCLADIHAWWWDDPDIGGAAVERDDAWVEQKSAAMRRTLARFLGEAGEGLPGAAAPLRNRAADGGAWRCPSLELSDAARPGRQADAPARLGELER